MGAYRARYRVDCVSAVRESERGLEGRDKRRPDRALRSASNGYDSDRDARIAGAQGTCGGVGADAIEDFLGHAFGPVRCNRCSD